MQNICFTKDAASVSPTGACSVFAGTSNTCSRRRSDPNAWQASEFLVSTVYASWVISGPE